MKLLLYKQVCCEFDQLSGWYNYYRGPHLRKIPFCPYAVDCCIERTKTSLRSPWVSADALSKNDNSRPDGVFFWYPQDRFFGKDSK